MKAWFKRHSKLYRFGSYYYLQIKRALPTLCRQRAYSFPSHFKLFNFLFIIGLGILGITSWSAYHFTFITPPTTSEILSSSMMTEQKILDANTQQHIDMLTQHIGRIEANLMRINALGERLVESAHLDPEEFNFNREVGTGGPVVSGELRANDLLATLTKLNALLDRRYAQLLALQQAIQVRLGQRELSFTGAGRAVANGWISSFFGARHDPFTGRRAWHSGVDIAGKEGAEIRALAGGVVSFAAVKGAYGRMVEIKHGNGLSTRYGHTKEILVTAGQIVRKGQTIAKLGSSGRSTGPHVHLEVHKNGKAVDPGLYFPDLKRR